MRDAIYEHGHKFTGKHLSLLQYSRSQNSDKKGNLQYYPFCPSKAYVFPELKNSSVPFKFKNGQNEQQSAALPCSSSQRTIQTFYPKHHLLKRATVPLNHFCQVNTANKDYLVVQCVMSKHCPQSNFD